MKTKGLVLSLLLLAGILQEISAQHITSGIPLIEYLKQLQQDFDVQFNYASNSLDSLNIIPHQKKGSLDSILVYLGEQTGLKFTLLNGNYISIEAREMLMCGFVKDNSSFEAIPNCRISVGTISGITDENGYFEINHADQNAELRVSHIGYGTIGMPAKSIGFGDCKVLYLAPEETRLPEVILYDYLIRGIDKLDNGSLFIDFEKFTILPGLVEQDVLQSIQAFPGIQSINETVSNINIRGGSNDQNLILWDGIKMYQSGHFFGLISMYNPEITQKVSLVKNGSPAAYTDGISGTISMETDGRIGDNAHGSISANFIDASGFADIAIGNRSSVQLAARKSLSDFFETPTYTEYFKRISQDTELEENSANVRNSEIGFDFYDASIRYLFTPREEETLRINFITTHNDLLFDENATVNGKQETRQSSLVQNSIAAGINYSRRWNKRLQTLLHVYNTDYKLKAINSNILNDQRFLQENKVSESSAKLSSLYSFNSETQLTNGYHFTETKVTNLDDVDDPVFIDLTGEVLREHSLFTQLSLNSAGHKSSLNLGFRASYLDKFNKTFWEPRISFSQRIGHDISIELLGEFKHQNTSQIINFQNDFLGIEKRRWQLADNANFPVIRSKQASLGFNYSHKGWLLSAEGYFKVVDGITSQSQGFQNQYEMMRSIGSYDAIGIDFLVRRQFGLLNTWLSYALLSSDYEFPKLSINKFANNFEIPNTVSAGVVWAPEKFRVAAGVNWRNGKPTTQPSVDEVSGGNTIPYDAPNSSRLEDYFRMDISAIYLIPLGKNNRAQLGFSIWNVLDKENVLNVFYRINESGTVEKTAQNSLGLTPNVTFKVFF